MIDRELHHTALARLRSRPAVAILGARQVGKTTLAKQLAKDFGGPSLRLDLEKPQDRALLKDPHTFLPQHADKLVVIDELQRMPELFQALRVLIDDDRRPGRFLLLGSSSPVIVQRAAESLAGRIAYLDLFPFSIQEVGFENRDKLWVQGGFPEAYLAPDTDEAFDLLNDHLRSFTERDLAALGLGAAPENTFNLLRMLASVHGQPLNMSMLSKSIGLSMPTVKHYLEFFTQAYMTFRLYSFHVNTRKRLTKAPKVYLTDSGMLHALSGIRDRDRLTGHALFGHSWEGFVIQQVRAWLGHRAELHYYRTLDGSEVDLVITQGTKAIAAIEIKTTNSPTLSKGNQLAFEAVKAPLQLICTPNAEDFPYSKSIRVCSLGTLFKHLDKVVG